MKFYITYLSYKSISQKKHFDLLERSLGSPIGFKNLLEKTFKLSVEEAPYQSFGSTVEEVDAIVLTTTFPTYRWNAHSCGKWLPVGDDNYEYIGGRRHAESARAYW